MASIKRSNSHTHLFLISFYQLLLSKILCRSSLMLVNMLFVLVLRILSRRQARALMVDFLSLPLVSRFGLLDIRRLLVNSRSVISMWKKNKHDIKNKDVYTTKFMFRN